VKIMTAENKSRILVVDDSLQNIKIIGAALRGDHQVLVATNGEDALRMAAKEPQPQLILLDVVMPEMDGYEVLRRLRATPETRDIPVIFLTARTDVEDEAAGLEAGAVDYVTKPFCVAVVQARVRTHLELKRHRDMLQNLSSVDGLTGVPNRRSFDQLIDREWRRAQRGGAPLSVMMVDVDHFKIFNDTYGHLAGDDCLKKVAAALSGAVGRAGDLLCRYGGEEFAAVLPDTNSAAALVVGERLRASVEALAIPHAKSKSGTVVTISLGSATLIPSERGSTADLVACADRALYAAKRSGRNRIVGDGQSTPSTPPHAETSG
jgi:diguanylate cyclase (GGDEF)-like protein